MRNQTSTKLSHIRHELAEVIGGLSSAKDLLKTLPGATTVEHLVQLTHGKLKEVITLVDKTKTELVGSYILETCKIKRVGSSEFVDWGKNVHGHLMYTSEETVSVSINREGTECKDSLFYAARYTHLEPGKLRHDITECSDYQRIGRSKLVSYEFKNGLLVMIAHASYGDIQLVWSRV